MPSNKSSFYRISLLCLALLAALFTAAGCGTSVPGDDPEEPEEDMYRLGDPITDPEMAVLLVADDGSIVAELTAAEFQERYDIFSSQNPGASEDEVMDKRMRRAVAEEFINRTLMLKEGERLGISVDPERIEAELASIVQRVGSQEQFEQILATNGMTLDSLRSQLAENFQLEDTQQKMAASFSAPSESEIKEFQKEQAVKVRSQHILFRIPDPADKDSVYAFADAVLDSVKSGRDFRALARRYGTDGSAQRGGDLGFLSRRDLVKPFSDAAFALSDSGDVVDKPVKTDFGYHIIRLLERKTDAEMDSSSARLMMVEDRQRDAFDEAIKALRLSVIVRTNDTFVGGSINEKLN